MLGSDTGKRKPETGKRVQPLGERGRVPVAASSSEWFPSGLSDPKPQADPIGSALFGDFPDCS
jgi:hypothetical protein